MELSEIVLKLSGPIRPVGEHNNDTKRLENIKELASCVTDLLSAISEASMDAGSQEASVRAIGLFAREFLREVKESIR